MSIAVAFCGLLLGVLGSIAVSVIAVVLLVRATRTPRDFGELPHRYNVIVAALSAVEVVALASMVAGFVLVLR